VAVGLLLGDPGESAALGLAPGELVVVDPTGPSGVLLRVTPGTGAQTPVSSGGSFASLRGIALAPNGDVFVADENAFGGNGGVIRVNPATGAQTPVSSEGSFVGPFGLAVAPPAVVTAAGPGGGPHVQVFDGRALFDGSLVLLRSFFAYDPGFAGGVFVGAVELTGDNKADIVTAAAAGGGPHVRAFDGATGAPLPGPVGNFFAFPPGFTGGVFVTGYR
jgi:hypothetical protein